MHLQTFPTANALLLALMVTLALFADSKASAQTWQDSFIFDACERATLVRTPLGHETAFSRREHFVKARAPVSLTVRYPRLFTQYRVLVEAQEVPEAIPVVPWGWQTSPL